MRENWGGLRTRRSVFESLRVQHRLGITGGYQFLNAGAILPARLEIVYRGVALRFSLSVARLPAGVA